MTVHATLAVGTIYLLAPFRAANATFLVVSLNFFFVVFFFFQAEDGIRDLTATGVQTCALPIFSFKKRGVLRNGEDQQRGIIMPCAATKFRRGRQDFLLKLGRARRAIFSQNLQKPLVTKLLAIGVAGFGDPVGKKNRAITCLQVTLAELEGLIRKNTEDSAAFVKALVRTIRAHHERRVVALVCIPQATRRAIELGVEQSDKAIAGHITAQQRVEAYA